MNQILLIEDDELKFALLKRFVEERLSTRGVSRACSYQAGIEVLVEGVYDIVFLDMTLPVSDLELSPVGMDYLTFGGQLVLRECKRRGINCKFIVISQFNTFVRDGKEVAFAELRMEILAKYGEVVLECVQLDRASDGWKEQIVAALNNENSNN